MIRIHNPVQITSWEHDMPKSKEQAPERSEGDVNLSPRRKAWAERHLDENAVAMLAEDASYFLHQSLSTPCLNAIQASEGIHLEDVQGRKIMDFHGNSVHQVGN
jgi:4-aminobutyrate aminotransferase